MQMFDDSRAVLLKEKRGAALYFQKIVKNLLTCSLGAGLQCDCNKEITVFSKCRGRAEQVCSKGKCY